MATCVPTFRLIFSFFASHGVTLSMNILQTYLTLFILTPSNVISLKCNNNDAVTCTILLTVYIQVCTKCMNLLYVLYYIYMYTLGACLQCGLWSLIVLTALFSLLYMSLIYTFFILSSYYEPTIIIWSMCMCVL